MVLLVLWLHNVSMYFKTCYKIARCGRTRWVTRWVATVSRGVFRGTSQTKVLPDILGFPLYQEVLKVNTTAKEIFINVFQRNSGNFWTRNPIAAVIWCEKNVVRLNLITARFPCLLAPLAFVATGGHGCAHCTYPPYRGDGGSWD